MAPADLCGMGAAHGVMRLLEKYFSKASIQNPGRVEHLNVLLVIKTFVITSFIWIFFRAENFSKAKQVIKALVKNMHCLRRTLIFHCFCFRGVVNGV